MCIAVLASGKGTILRALVEARLDIAVVVVDRPCDAEQIAYDAGLPLERVMRPSFGPGFDREAFTSEVVAVLRRYDFSLIAMAGYGTVLGAAVHRAFPERILNTHPALLPAFKGWHAVAQAIESGATETGCTVHIARLEVDEGPILAQEVVKILPGDTEGELSERIKEVERRLYPAAIFKMLEQIEMGRTRSVRALLSVYDKTGLAAFAKGLEALGYELVASGGTAALLSEVGVEHRTVEDVTESREMLGGRVKTLHPAIHGGILADLSDPSHVTDIEVAGIAPISVVACNLYPFQSDPSIEMIDIGGPTMVRSAAKNHAHVAVIVDPADYGPVLDELRNEREVTAPTRGRLARKAFAHVAAYDAAIVSWFDSEEGPTPVAATGSGDGDCLPTTLHLSLERAQDLRYGENPHQAGARYRASGGLGRESLWDSVTQHGGRELSYLNIFDADAAWKLVHEVAALPGVGSSAVIVKHANPCGAAVAGSLREAYDLAFLGDPLSAFGGIVALSGSVDLELADKIVANPLADVLIAPGYSDEAVDLLVSKRKNMRVLTAPAPGAPGVALRQIDGGWLVQEPDRVGLDVSGWRCVTERQVTDDQWVDALLAWLVCARTSSNAIVLANAGQVVGVGCGQQSRVDAAKLAGAKAGTRASQGVGASDAFFPFRDGLDAVADAGVSVVVQPGGSLRDDEVVVAANERGVAMLTTGERHFRH